MASEKGEKAKPAKNRGKKSGLDRRDFFKRGVTTAAGAIFSLAGLPEIGSAAEKESAGPLTQLPKRRLGRTGLKVSVVAFGGSPFCEDISPPVPEKTVAKMLDKTMEMGLNFIDTSHLYGRGHSERAFGQALRGRRDKVIIFSRCPSGWGKSTGEMLDESLQRLGTDYIDVYGTHGTRMSEDIADRLIERVLPELEKAKKDGKIRHIAATAHQSPAGLVKMIETGKIDVVQVPINPLWREFLEVVIPAAKKNDVGIVAMKPTWRGRLLTSSPEVDAIIGSSKKEKLVNLLGFGLSQEIASVSVGFLHEPQIKEDIGAALSFLSRGDKGFSKEEAKSLALKAHETVKDNCRVCNRCMPCPVRIDVPRVLRLELYARHYGFKDWAKAEYRRVRRKADLCTKCGECTEKCPYGIPAQELVLRAAKQLA